MAERGPHPTGHGAGTTEAGRTASIPRPRTGEHDHSLDTVDPDDHLEPTETVEEPTHEIAEKSTNKLQFVIVGLDENIRAQAFEAANAIINEKTQGEGFKGFLKKVFTGKFKGSGKHLGEMGRQMWYGNIAREYHLMREAQKAKKTIIEQQNLLAHEGGVATGYEAATLRRFGEAADTYDGMIRESAGEKREKLNLETHTDGTPDAEGQKVKGEIVDLVRRNLRGDFATQADFVEAEKAMLANIVANDPKAQEYLGKGQLYAANLYEISQSLKASSDLDRLDATERDAKIDEMLSGAEIVLGEGRVGVRGGVERGMAEKLADKASQVPFLNETTIYTAAGLVVSAGGWLTKATVGKALAMAGGLGLGGGAIAALRAGRAFRQERDLHEREMAKGKYNTADLEGRRAEMEKTRFETKSAQELIDQIGLIYDDKGELRLHDPNGMLMVIADAEARLNLSDEQDRNFLGFSDKDSVDTERTKLMLAVAKAKTDIGHHLKSASDAELRALGIPDEQFDVVRGAQFPADYILSPVVSGQEAIIGLDTGSIIEGIEADVAAKNRVARRMKAEDMSKAMFVGTIFGAAGAAVMQETIAGVHSGQQGVFEDNAAGHKDTVLHRAFHSEEGGGHKVSIAGETQNLAGAETSINLPKGFDLDKHGNTFTVTGPNGLQVDGLRFTEHGTLTDASVQELRANGVNFTLTPDFIVKNVATEVKSTASDWHAHHKDITDKVTREWQHNRTSEFDKNELRLDNAHLDKKGNITISMARMTSGGSYDFNSAVDVNNPSGQLKMAFTLSDQTLSKAVMVDVGPNGRAVIPPGHPLHSMFTPSGGRDASEMQFQGKWMQAVHDKGPGANGAHRLEVLATDVNNRGPKVFTETITTKTEVPNYKYHFEYSAPNDNPVLVPFGPPVYGRRGLETPVAVAKETTTDTEGGPTIPPTTPPGPGPTVPPRAPTGEPTPPRTEEGRSPEPEPEQPQPFRNPRTGQEHNFTAPTIPALESAAATQARHAFEEAQRQAQEERENAERAAREAAEEAARAQEAATREAEERAKAEQAAAEAKAAQEAAEEAARRAKQEAEEAEREAKKTPEQKARDAKDKANREKMRQESESILHDVLRTTQPAGGYPFGVPYLKSVPITDAGRDVITRAYSRVIQENTDLDPYNFPAGITTKERNKRLRQLKRSVTRYIAPDRFKEFTTEEEAKVLLWAYNYWQVAGNPENIILKPQA